MNTFYTMTFRISKQTELGTLKTIACDYWGLNEKQFKFFNDQVENDNDLESTMEEDNDNA